MQRAFPALLPSLLLISAPLFNATFAASGAQQPQRNPTARIEAEYAQLLQEMPPDIEGTTLDSVAWAALRQQWELVGQYLATRAATAPPTTADGYAALVSALDPTLQTQVAMLDAHTAVLELIAAPGPITYGDIGHLMVVALSPPGAPTVWHIDKAAQGQNAEALACWTTADRSCAGSITVLPTDAEGDHRFFVDAAIAQFAGGTRGRQLSVWRWDAREAQLLFLQEYATGPDDSGAGLIGDQIRIGEKGQWDTLSACGGCDGRGLLQTLQITPQGIVDKGAVSTTPELDAVDEVYARIRDGRSAEDLASPAALQTMRASWPPRPGSSNPFFFINDEEIVTHQDNRSQLCFRAEYPLNPILFTFERHGSELYILNAQRGSEGC